MQWFEDFKCLPRQVRIIRIRYFNRRKKTKTCGSCWHNYNLSSTTSTTTSSIVYLSINYHYWFNTRKKLTESVSWIFFDSSHSGLFIPIVPFCRTGDLRNPLFYGLPLPDGDSLNIISDFRFIYSYINMFITNWIFNLETPS